MASPSPLFLHCSMAGMAMHVKQAIVRGRRRGEKEREVERQGKAWSCLHKGEKVLQVVAEVLLLQAEEGTQAGSRRGGIGGKVVYNQPGCVRQEEAGRRRRRGGDKPETVTSSRSHASSIEIRRCSY